MNYRYQLESGGKHLFTCPSCGKQKVLVRYIDTEAGKYVADNVGRCNREINCGYHYKPKQFFQDSSTISPLLAVSRTPGVITLPDPSFIPFEVFKKSLERTDLLISNHFVSFLKNQFGEKLLNELAARFYITSSNHWPGSTVFWQIDEHGKIRAGKIMQYNAITGRRIKEPHNYINWVHKMLKLDSFTLKPCLFGLHQINTETKYKTVAIVESEKSAIVATAYLPDFIWMATGGIQNLNKEKLLPLKGRKIILFPDLGAYDKWKTKAAGLSKEIDAFITVSDLLEKKASETDKQKGFDVADYLLKNPLKSNSNILQHGIKKEHEPTLTQIDIDDLIVYFSSIDLPDKPLQLGTGAILMNVSRFVESHCNLIMANRNKDQLIRPYVDRLLLLKKKISNN